MSGSRIVAAAFLAVLLLTGGAAAAPDSSLTVAYQGYLADLKGQPIDGTRHLVFTLHSDATGGEALWNETHEGVTVAKGVFGVVLGTFQALEVPTFDNARWLGIRVAGEDSEMAPRQRLGSAPFAFIAQRANTLSASATIQGSQITGTITGATMPGVAPWVTISSASQQAASNTGYVVASGTQVNITLPAAPAVGDVVKVSSAGLGGPWTLVPNPGQVIVGGNVQVVPNWVLRDSTRNWRAVASSADGVKLVAVVTNGHIYTSVDSGVFWTARATDAPRNWISVASSADGTKLVAAVSGGQIHSSPDSGVTWIPREPARPWVSVASSADGMKLVAVENPGGSPNPGGLIYTSPDSGVNWSPRETEPPRAWRSVASSADGTKLVAAVTSGFLYTSPDSGVNWFQRGSSGLWDAVASSADGTRLLAAGSKNGIYTSIDSGDTWIPRGSVGNEEAAASSASGTRLAVAGGNTANIHLSVNSGLSWSSGGPDKSWRGVAASADGTKFVAVAVGAPIYTTEFRTLTGDVHASAELVYAGGGQWVVVNQQGALTTP